MTTVYLLAHQDDEIGVFHHIRTTLASGERAVCIFMTDGAFRVSASTRNAESLRVLSWLGLPDGDVLFVGDRAGIRDGALVETLERALKALQAALRPISGISRLVIPAFEGGHHDHDALHILGQIVSRELGVFENSRQFSLYRAADARGTVAFGNPDAGTLPSERQVMPWLWRMRYLLAIRHYRSQLAGLTRLMPCIGRHFLVDGVQVVQPLPPLERCLALSAPVRLYDLWGLYRASDFMLHAGQFLESQGTRSLARDRAAG